MADAHLEKMGRELKCPICLSLLDSAASLTCNHVFCNSCILKSMKSGSSCPVCKVPYQRREIRPAPHMDNLVKIYKSMEVASGVSLFVSQPPTTTKRSGAENHTECDADAPAKENDLETPKTAKRKRMKGSSKKLSKSKPSSLTNKRVQMPQSPSTETPIRQAREEFGKMKMITEPPANSQQLQNGKGSPNLTPLFWLREDEDEDVEKPSQQIEPEPLTGTPAKAPSFSDIKDSEDYYVPSNMSPKEGTLKRCNNVDIFDSEMFEWTQRACSPELCSSPTKVADTLECDRVQDSFREHLDNISSMETSNTQAVEPHTSFSPQRESDSKKNGTVVPCKRGGKAINGTQTKRRKKNAGGLREFPDVDETNESLPDEVSNIVSELPPRSGSEKIVNKEKKSKKSKRSLKSTKLGNGERCEDMKSKPSEDEFPRKRVERNGDDQRAPRSDNLKGSSRNNEIRTKKDTTVLRKCDLKPTYKRAFCLSAEETEASGEMVHYSQGRPVPENHSTGSVIHSHRNCTEWAPNVYFENDIAVNLDEELTRSRRIKCSLCGKKGAALGCYEKSCRKSFHVPCAKALKECRWDNEHFVILCPLHASSKLPSELPTSQLLKKGKSSQKGKNLHQQAWLAVTQGTNRTSKSFNRPSEKLVLCCSGLSAAEKETVSEFAKASGAVVSTSWNSAVTHVIASVDENRACRRTLKVLMGILEGKWILSIKWVEACMKALAQVDEAPFEISCDIHGIKNGPRLGRLRHLNKKPKLFSGFKFYLTGDFAPSYKGYLQDLLTAAGGTVLHRKPVSETDGTDPSAPPNVIIYSVELLQEKCDVRNKDRILGRRRSDAEALAAATGSKVADNLWVLNCIAGYKLQDL